MIPGVTVRAMTMADLDAARGLLAQLGYDIAAEELDRRFRAVAEAGGHHALMVAELDGGLVGLLHAFARPALEKPTEALVQSLVVEENQRGGGIGRLLMDRAEAWARGLGLASMTLHTRATRADARAFYRGLGFEEVAEAMLMRKTLADK